MTNAARTLLMLLAALAPAPLAGAAEGRGTLPGMREGQQDTASPAGAPAGRPDRIETGARCPDDLRILVAAPFGRDRDLAPGDTVRVRSAPEAQGCRAVVSGLFRPRPDPSRLTVERPRVLFHLPHLARLSGRAGEVDRFSVRLAPGTDPERMGRELSGLMPGTRILPTRQVAEQTSTTFEVVRRFHRAIGLITLTAGSVFLCCIMILKVQERRTEVAALRLVGVSRETLLGWIAAEAAMVSVLGAGGGIGLGYLASDLINRFYRNAYDTTLLFSLVTPETLWLVTALAVVLGLGAGLAAGLHLLSLDPLEEVGR